MRNLSENFLQTKSESRSLTTNVAERVFPNWFLTGRYDPVFNDGFSLHWLKVNLKARNKFLKFEPDTTSKVGVFSHSRGGSHLFITQFHYLKTAFCFNEGFSSFDREKLNFRAFLLRSTFGVNGLQNKDPLSFTHLIYNNNFGRAPQLQHWTANYKTPFNRYWICYLRNPLRTLISLNKTGKEKWRLTKEFTKAFCNQIAEDLECIRNLKERFPENVKVVLHEKFCHRPKKILYDVFRFLGIPDEIIKTRQKPENFFQRFLRCGSTPEQQDGWLVSPVSGERIKGWGGNFNPLEPIHLERAYRADIVREIPAESLTIAREILGEKRFNIWCGDISHQYNNISEFDLLQL